MGGLRLRAAAAAGLAVADLDLVVAGLAGLVFGGGLLLRGLDAYRRAAIVSSIATSHTDGLAAGEVRLTGRVEP